MVYGVCLTCSARLDGADQNAIVAAYADHRAAVHPNAPPLLRYVDDNPPPPAPDYSANAQTLRDRVNAQLGALVNAADAIAAGTATAAQKDQALVLALRTLARLARLVLAQLDVTP